MTAVRRGGTVAVSPRPLRGVETLQAAAVGRRQCGGDPHAASWSCGGRREGTERPLTEEATGPFGESQLSVQAESRSAGEGGTVFRSGDPRGTVEALQGQKRMGKVPDDEVP